MYCQKCKKQISEEFLYCPYCAYPQKTRKQKPKMRGNGTGSVYKEKNGTYRAVVVLGYITDENGKKYKKTHSKRGFKTKKEALEYIPHLKNSVPSIDENIKFNKLYEDWYKIHSQKVGKSTMDCYKSAFKHFAPIHFMNFALIKTDNLQKCVDDCGQGKRTKQNMKALGTLLYKYAMQNDVVSKNYAEFIYTGNDKQTEREPFTQQELRKLFDSVPTNPDARYVLILCYTGFRPEEFLKIQQTDYDKQNNALISGSKTEAGKNRIVPISSKIANYVKELAENKDYIFSPNGTKISQKYFRNEIFYPALEKAGVKRLTPYSCRHTFATLMKNVNAPTTDKQKLIGHSKFEMTAHYTHTDIESLKAIVDNL